MRYLAIDYGSKRTGLALCDGGEMIASPYAVLENPAQVIQKVLEVIKDEQVEAVVVGLPLNMDGSEGPAAKGVRKFAKELGGQVDIPIVLHDERLSSFEAQGKLAAADFTRKKKKKRLDAIAAAAILQSFLDKKHEEAKAMANLVVVSDHEELSRKAFEIFVEAARDAIADKGVFRTAISGGNTPRRFFELLGQSQDSLALAWEKIHLFWVDERRVGPDSEQSNYKAAADTFLSKVGIPVENVHRIAGESQDSEAAARAYEDTIRKVFDIEEDEVPAFDLIVLGMGADGHTASLFPYSAMIEETSRLAAAVQPGGDKVNRITLTVPVLLAAERVVVLVSGADKAQTLAEVVSGEADKMRYPIRSLWPSLEKVTWIVDAEAARFVKAF